VKPNSTAGNISLAEKSAYGFAGLGAGLVRNMLGLYLLFYYSGVIGLSPAYMSMAIMIGNIWDAVTDPLMGFISDHTESRMGRRRVYLFWGAFSLGFLVYLTWAPPSSLQGFTLFLYAAVLISLLNANFTVVLVPYLALGAELSSDPDERSTIFGFNYAFSTVGQLLGAVIPSLAIEFADDAVLFLHGRFDLFSNTFTQTAVKYLGDPSNVFRLTAAAIGIIVTASTLATFFGTRERVVHERDKKVRGTVEVFKTLYRDLFSTLKNRPFLILVLAMMTIDIGSGITGSMMMFVAKYWIKMEKMVSLFIITYMLCAIGAAAFWVQFSKWTSKKLAYLLGQTVLTIALLSTMLMVEGKPLRVFAILAFSGFGLGAYVMLWSLIADRVDYDEYETHKRREGSYYGIYTLFSKSAAGIGVFLGGLYLEFIGFEKGMEMFEKGIEIPPDMLLKFKLLFGPITALINLAGVIIFWFFHYDKKEHEQIQNELVARKGEMQEAREVDIL
jgi:GPH family glycoside/pentoside/hexuronide:cation symporter